MRHRLPVLAVLCLLLASFYAEKYFASDSSIRVNEAASRVQLENGETSVTLAIENFTGRAIEAIIRLEWLDPRNFVDAKVERRETIKPGASKITIPFPLIVPSHREEETLWYRLRYRIAADPSAKSPSVTLRDPVSGVIALSEITPEIFELHVLASEYPYPGKLYRAHVRAVHPITSRPVRGVAIAARLKFDNDREDSFKAGAVTNARGYAALDFDLPRDLDISDGTIEVSGARGDFKHQVEEDLRDDHSGLTDLMLTTDKPIYQPGQTLHTRILAFDFARRAIANARLALKITDPEGTMQYRANAMTSRFGVAHFDWQIPENARLGDYTISVDFDDDRDSYERELRVRISRYDLPNFAVKARPDRNFYLPGQSAEVEIRADYLFGQPVTRGRVRVVRELERQWNYHQQKWEIREAEKYEGETDASGRFFARIDLAKAHQELKDNDYRRFDDLTYAAYFTDATTGRTEQRRFDLRVTRDAIHVYVIGDDDQAEGLPVWFYVSTSYADGTPASCEVAISEQIKIESLFLDEFIEEPLRTIKTNRYGVAKVAGLKLRERDGNDPSLVLAARDAKGATGRHVNKLWKRDRGLIRIETDKAIYRAGEPIEIRLTSNRPNIGAVLSLSRDLQPLHSQSVRMRNGRAFVVIPWRREFNDVISITAYAELGDESFRPMTRQVIFPRDRELRLAARLDRTEYRPGEEAQASFRMLSPDGRPVESALGVAVIDRAVEERARTDREFSRRGHYYDYISSYFNRYETLAGISVRDLRKLDLSNPLPAGLELVAEVLLHSGGYEPIIHIGSEYDKDQRAIFSKVIDSDLDPIEFSLNLHYERTGEYPTDQDSLRRILKAGHKSFDDLRDPWETPYRAEFSTEREMDVLKIVCAGADEKFNTADDFTAMKLGRPYFKPAGEIINQVQQQYLDREGMITRDPSVFKKEMARGGPEFDALRDRWSRPYELELSVTGTQWNVTVRSSGENGKFEPRDLYSSDDFTVWAASVDYFAKTRARIDAILADHFKTTGRFPENERELRSVLEQSGFPMNGFRDAWGNDYSTVFSHRFRYADRVVISYSDLQAIAKQKTEVKPITQQVNFIALRSRGADGKEGTPDDFTLAEFSRVATEQTSQDSKPQAVSGGASYSGATGAIGGTVVDPLGAVITGAIVTASYKITGQTHQVKSDDKGSFLIRNLPAGRYDVRCEAMGFRAVIVADVPVQSSTMTSLNFTLDVGATAETVTVMADGSQLQTQSSAMKAAQVGSLPFSSKNALSLAKLAPGAQVITQSGSSTPRLREYFQETLVWQPMIETDKQGRAHLKFKLADNITTWKMKVVGSTIDGEIAVAEKEFLAFQPFFAEHDPPKVLTEGDEISLPVVLRNYLSKSQTVEAEIKPESWFTLSGPARKRAEVKAGDAERVIFDFRAATPIKDGKQRITAIGTDASDAIERPVNVHPDGEEITQTISSVFTDAGSLNINVPEDAIKGTARAELKIYPNLMAHALEGIEGILQRPYGCAEQTISSTYPNVMVLRYLKGQDERAPDIVAKARRYVQRGYERLLGYRAEDGGFSYWGRGEPDVALTAYALRFLNDASQFVAVDEDVIKQVRAWLVKQQQPDGRWIARYWRETEDTRRTALSTAFIARVLAMDAARDSKPEKTVTDALKRALDYLAKRIEEIDEPYLIASYALAAINAGDREAAEKAVAKLRSLARDEAGTNYWHPESNTPFYGWGLAGRIETTALAVNAMKRAGERESGRVGERESGGAGERESERAGGDGGSGESGVAFFVAEQGSLRCVDVNSGDD